MFSRKSFSQKSFSKKSWWMGIVSTAVKLRLSLVSYISKQITLLSKVW